MIIEFVGLPGVGKTTVARRTASELGAEYINLNSVGDKFLYPILFIMRSPLTFLSLLFKTIKEAGMSFRRVRYMLFVLFSMGSRDAKAVKLGKYRTVVLDGGLTQYGLSIYRHKITYNEANKYLSHVNVTRELRCIYESREVRVNRMKKRGCTPRTGIEGDHERWMDVQEHNEALFRTLFANKKKKLCYVLPEYDENTDTHFYHLYEFVKELKAKMNLSLIVEKDGRKKPSAVIRLARDMRALIRARRRSFTDVYVHYSFIGALAGLFSGMRVYYWNCGMPWKYRRSWFRERVFRYILEHTVLVTGCDSLAAEYKKHYKLLCEPKILPNWINLDRFKIDRKSSGKKTVLFVHHLSNRKGADMIAPTAKKLQDVEFIVVGNGSEMPKLKAQSAESKNIQIIGRVPNKEISGFFAKADVFFMPSEEEGFPRVLLEAMAMGVPYVASDVGCVRAITPPELQPYVVTDRTPQNFAKKIRALLDLEAESPSRLSAVLQEYVKLFELRRALNEFLELFE